MESSRSSRLASIPLSSWFFVGLLVTVSELHAQSPTPAQPAVEKLVPLGVVDGEVVGFHPRIAGDWIAVGGRFADGDVPRGTLHVFERREERWVHAQRLVAPEPAAGGDAFGAQSAFTDNLLVVGDHGAAKDGVVTGAVHVYRLAAGGWELAQTLHMDQPRANAGFGAALAIDGDTLAVGEAEGLVPGGWGDNRAVHVFQRDGGRWHAAGVLQRPDDLVVAPALKEKSLAETGMARHAGFGAHLDLQGDRLVVSAMGAGALLSYRRGHDGWQLVQRIDEPASDIGFPRTVALDGEALVAGALRADGAQRDTGVAYLYREVAGRWQLAQTLSLPNGRTLDMFGHWVAADDGVVVAGAQGRLLNAGVAYAFRPGEDGLVLDAVLNPPDAWRRRMSAYALDLDAGTVVMSPGEELLSGTPLAAPGPGGVFVVRLAPARAG